MDLKCPFAAPLITNLFSCSHAREVVRRGGSEFDCDQALIHGRCTRVFEQLKAAALPAFGVEDDLLSMPHSVVVKIQCGGLLGLQRELTGQSAERNDDIDSLIAGAVQRYGESIPADGFVEDIASYKVRARRR